GYRRRPWSFDAGDALPDSGRLPAARPLRDAENRGGSPLASGAGSSPGQGPDGARRIAIYRNEKAARNLSARPSPSSGAYLRATSFQTPSCTCEITIRSPPLWSFGPYLTSTSRIGS